MPYPNKLWALASACGVSREEFVISKLRKHGTALGVAQELGVATNTINSFLKNNLGYRFEGNEWVAPDVSGKVRRDGANVGSRNTAAQSRNEQKASRNEGERTVVQT